MVIVVGIALVGNVIVVGFVVVVVCAGTDSDSFVGTFVVTAAL